MDKARYLGLAADFVNDTQIKNWEFSTAPKSSIYEKNISFSGDAEERAARLALAERIRLGRKLNKHRTKRWVSGN